MSTAFPKKVIVLGGGGHARVVLEALRASGAGEAGGILDRDPARHGESLAGVTILGGDELLPRLVAEGYTHFALGFGGVAAESPRRRLFESGLAAGLQPLTVVHPQAIVSPSATLAAGVQVLAGAIVNAGAMLGVNVLVNSGAIVEHDCRVGPHSHVASGACLCGAVTVGEGAHLGARCVVRQLLTVGAGALVAAGAVVVKDVLPGQTVAGIPARPLPAR